MNSMISALQQHFTFVVSPPWPELDEPKAMLSGMWLAAHFSNLPDAYETAVRRLARDQTQFAKFRQDPTYQIVLEHTQLEEATLHLKAMQLRASPVHQHVGEWKSADGVGSPTLADFGDGL